jgi:hypothetical protein
LCFLLGLLSGLLALYFKYLYEPPKSFIATPLPLLTVLMVVLGFLSILMGLLAELVIRTYYESQGRTTYRIAARPPRD